MPTPSSAIDISVFADASLGLHAGQTIELGRGRYAKVVDPALYEHVDHIICAEFSLPLPNSTTKSGPCGGACGRTLMWNAASPSRPRKLCMACSQERDRRRSMH